MTAESFTITSRGQHRREVLSNARHKAAAWFEVDPRCVNARIIGLVTEETENITLDGRVQGTVYAATVDATIAHQWNRPSTGFPKCTNCGAKDYR